MSIKYSKDLEWLKPFIDAVDGWFIDASKIKAIKGFRVPLNKQQHVLGRTTKFKGKYTITLLAQDQRYDHYVYTPIENILVTLAHELSHLIFWNEHDADFALLYGEIFKEFTEEVYEQQIPDIQAGHNTLRRKNGTGR